MDPKTVRHVSAEQIPVIEAAGARKWPNALGMGGGGGGCQRAERGRGGVGFEQYYATDF